MKQFLSIKKITVALVAIFSIVAVLSINGCAPTKGVAAKSGAQLWAENCQRCHNTPSPASYSAEQWETIGMHMQTRALITEAERKKIVDFLKSSR